MSDSDLLVVHREDGSMEYVPTTTEPPVCQGGAVMVRSTFEPINLRHGESIELAQTFTIGADQ